MDEDEDWEADVPEELKLDGRRYHHLAYKAHYEDRCEKNHRLDGDPGRSGACCIRGG